MTSSEQHGGGIRGAINDLLGRGERDRRDSAGREDDLRDEDVRDDRHDDLRDDRDGLGQNDRLDRVGAAEDAGVAAPGGPRHGGADDAGMPVPGRADPQGSVPVDRDPSLDRTEPADAVPASEPRHGLRDTGDEAYADERTGSTTGDPVHDERVRTADATGAGTGLDPHDTDLNRSDASRTDREHRDMERTDTELAGDPGRVEGEHLDSSHRTGGDRLEGDRLEGDRLDSDRLDSDRLDSDRLDSDRLDSDRLDGERVEGDRVEGERPHGDRLDDGGVGGVAGERRDADRLDTDTARTGTTDAGMVGDGGGAAGTATAHTATGTGVSDRSAGATNAQGEANERLVSADRADSYTSRWNEVKGMFVDEPRQAVGQADSLVGELLDELQTVFTQQRHNLEHGLDNEETSTEDLRVALRRYRSFFDRLLAI